MLKKSLLAVALASILTGCGGSSDGTDSGSTDTGSTTYTVIDGYLSAAEVYVLSPDGGTEILIGETDANGKIQIEAKYKGYTVIAKIIAGKTTDSDSAGFVAKSYEMRSTVDSTVVTPFTTLANISVMTLTALAAELQLDEADVSGDYVKSTDGKAHLVARGLAKKLDDDNDDDDAPGLRAYAGESVSYIDTNFTENDDLKEVELNDDNSSHHARIANIVDFIEDGKTFYGTSFSQYYSSIEGIMEISLVDGKGTSTYNDTNKTDDTFNYTIDNNKVMIDGVSDEYIYVSKELVLSVTADNDLFVYSKADLNSTTGFTADEIQGKTWYVMNDTNTAGTQAIEIFTASLTLHATNQTLTAAYDEEVQNGTYTLINGTLALTIENDAGPSDYLEFRKGAGNEDMIIAMEVNSATTPIIFSTEKNFVSTLAGKWAMLSK
ncbi:hypothetical protein Ping_1960 [Psychromonas ingrahamii 37]|uniref:Lipoprotein n=1 Tax=Psychromonas ingrahamii (strain DSM 17664 / CCUG 51855 / 37) TaxID=357804 RepID=A1SW64_PSYIN|nr:hypothetical protein [Psychromonas ingrahamii]ABM03729.1 hypothetical protein Ping_1960 [Psychromonas ingrahamii 37]